MSTETPISSMIEFLENKKFNSMILESNPHAANYEDLSVYIERWPDIFEDNCSEEKTEMIERNTFWQCTIYERTPIGSIVFISTTLENTIKKAYYYYNCPAEFQF